jgi:general secretion pathway protein G
VAAGVHALKSNSGIFMIVAAAFLGFTAVIVGAWLFLDRGPQVPVLPPGVAASPDALQTSEAQISAARRVLDSSGIVALAIERFHRTMARYPRDLDELRNPPASAGTNEHWNGPYVNNPKLLIDPWGHPYRYVAPGQHNTESYDIWTVGPDGQSDNTDDMGNW